MARKYFFEDYIAKEKELDHEHNNWTTYTKSNDILQGCYKIFKQKEVTIGFFQS